MIERQSIKELDYKSWRWENVEDGEWVKYKDIKKLMREEIQDWQHEYDFSNSSSAKDAIYVLERLDEKI